ncbi:hypothetical protein AAG906_036808 [Vitis piasezkii]
MNSWEAPGIQLCPCEASELQKFEDDDCGIPSVVSDQMEYGILIHGDKGMLFCKEVLFTTTLSNLHIENFNAFNNGA